MIAANVYGGFGGYFTLLKDVLAHLAVLQRPAVRDVLVRQIHVAGVATLSALVVRAAAIGTLIIAYMIHILAADAAYAVRILLWAVLREIGPLFAVVLLIVRSGTAMASEFALMRERGELDHLRMMGINPRDYIVIPTVVAVAISNVVVTFYLQILAVGGGMVLSSMLMDVSLAELLEHFFALVSLWDLLYAIIKSLGFGVLVGLVICIQGLSLGGSAVPVPQAVSRAVMQSIAAVLFFNAVFAYLVFGVLLFGIVKAP